MTDHTNTDHDPDKRKREARIEFVTSLALAGGLFALGLGAGLHVSLIGVQSAVVDATALSLQAQISSDLYDILLQMQAWANRSLYTAAVLLVGGAFVSERRQVRERVQRLTTRLEDADENTSGDRDA